MSPAAFAVRSLRRDPLRSALGIAGVAVVGALLLDMLLLSRGLLLSFRDLLEQTGYDVRVTQTASLPGMGPPIERAAAALATIEALPEVSGAAALRFDAGTARTPDGRLVEIGVLGVSPAARRQWRVLRGEDLGARPKDGPPEVLVTPEMADALGLEPGGTVRLSPGPAKGSYAPPPRPFRVAGVAKTLFHVEGSWTAMMRLPAFEAAGFGGRQGTADFFLVASAPGGATEETVRAVRRVRPDLHAYSIRDVVRRLSVTDFSYFRQISLVLSSITTFFAFLLLTTLLTVSVNQRLGEVAALRAIGFSRRRVCLDLLAEAALLAGSGMLLALPAGLALARILDGILRGMPGLPARLHFFVLEPRAVLLHLGILSAIALAAAAWPVRIAGRLPIADTLRREVIS